jgi:basic amino acid/polyamine antiporter, APA family
MGVLRWADATTLAPVSEAGDGRTVGLWAATGVGLGAIVGGGILVLAGVAFQATGPSTLVAFAVNGVVAVLTALSFAEMSTAFPESGGAYTFAKKVLTVRAAFALGWVLWFAYIVAGVLYALGFAEYAVAVLVDLWRAAGGTPPDWLRGRTLLIALSLAATAIYTISMLRKSGGGGQWETVGKMVLFGLLIIAGLVALVRSDAGTVERGMTPFFAHGFSGVLSAMGYTFIALQGFDLIAAIGGEVKDPQRNIPKAMLISLGIAVLVYLPLLFVVITVGTPPEGGIAQMSASSPATVMADAARNFAGPVGYWFVMLAALLSTLSALAANILAASHVALTMAGDRTLPRVIAARHPTRNTPVMAVYASALTLVVILLMVPDVAAAGAAASLIFLVSFALVHVTAFLARRRARVAAPFRTPWFPVVPMVGGGACAALALFQAVAVPAAGGIAAVWLGFGVILYFALFSGRARAVDAFTEALDPEIAMLRGRSPLVLVPVANPANAPGMIALANAMAPPVVGQVLLLAVIRKPARESLWHGEMPDALERAQHVIREALSASFATGHTPQTVLTVADEPWSEIVRVARVQECESLLLGMATLDQAKGVERLEELLNDVECDVVVLHARPGWSLERTTRIVVPIGGRGGHDDLRARLLGSLGRAKGRVVRFVRIVAPSTPESQMKTVKRELQIFAEEEARNHAEAEVIPSDAVVEAIAGAADEGDLLVLGLQRHRGKRLFGAVTLQVARRTRAATLLISRGR